MKRGVSMQKRTNPLALKEDAVADNGIRRDRTAAPKSQVNAPKEQEGPVKVAPPVSSAAEVKAAPVTVSHVKKASEFAGAGSRVPDVAEPDLMDHWLESVVLDDEDQEEQSSLSSAASSQLHPSTSFVPSVKRDDVPAATEIIEDEEPFPTMEDFELASRFSLRGNVSRRIVLGTVSRDVCRLAQLLHPEQKLSTIIENALMTRIFLENPEAFDAMASVIEEKGGRIKC